MYLTQTNLKLVTAKDDFELLMHLPLPPKVETTDIYRDINGENILTLVAGKAKKQVHKGYSLSGMVGAVT